MGFMRAEQVFHFGESKTPSLLFPFKNLMNPKTTFVVCVRALGLDLNQRCAGDILRSGTSKV